MQRMDHESSISPGVADSGEEVGCPPDWFIAPEWYRRDLVAVFRPAWQFAGHASELKEEGSFITFSLGADEAIILRGRDGSLKAYYNFCRHRGHRLCSNQSGNFPMAGRVVCPYHGWTYSTDNG